MGRAIIVSQIYCVTNFLKKTTKKNPTKNFKNRKKGKLKTKKNKNKVDRNQNKK